jgi:hypothetical protein
MTTAAPLRCKCRKQAPTSLRCARCFVPICPDCSRVAPAGMLCRECATGQKSHLYQVSGGHVARGFLASLAAATFGGWLIASIGSFGFFMLWLGFLYGLGVAEVALRAADRKRGTVMEIIVGISCLGGLVLGWCIETAVTGEPNFFALKDPWTYAAIAAAICGAIGRVRSL